MQKREMIGKKVNILLYEIPPEVILNTNKYKDKKGKLIRRKDWITTEHTHDRDFALSNTWVLAINNWGLNYYRYRNINKLNEWIENLPKGEQGRYKNLIQEMVSNKRLVIHFCWYGFNNYKRV